MVQSLGSLLALVLIVLLGVVLVANPLWLAPGGAGQYTMTYHVDPVENESIAQQAIGLSEQVLECPGERACELERRVHEEGPIEADGPITADERRYPVVRIDGDLYRPVVRTAGDSTVLALESLSPEEAVEAAAIPVSEFRSDVRTAVETGSVTVVGDRIGAFERGQIVEHENEFYYREASAFRGGYWATAPVLPLVRGLLVAVGCGLLTYAGWRYRGIDG